MKCSGLFLLFLLSVVVVACSSGAGAVGGNLGNPPVTVTIQLGGNNGSPTPPLQPLSCGAWATNTSPAYNTTTTVGVYAKFVQNKDMNPVGVGGATATATVTWPDGSVTNFPATTTNDGLAVFAIPVTGRAFAINKFTFISVSFHKDGVGDCTVQGNQVAFFTLVMVSPTATITAVPSPSATPSMTPTGTLTPTCTATPRPTPIKPRKTPTPSPFPPPGC